MEMRRVSCLIIMAVWLFGGIAQGQDRSDFVGLWESLDQAGLALELREDGVGVAYQSADRSFDVEWTVDTEVDPMRLFLTINGQTRVSLVELDEPDEMLMTEPRAEAPDGFRDTPVMRLGRVDIDG